LYLHGESDPFFPLVQNLTVGVAGAVALLACIVIIGASLRSFVRGQELMNQLALARAVQQAFLPSAFPDYESLELATEYIPNSEVSGDYYNLFSPRKGQLTLILGDVSGKGLPAALVVGLLHGAIRFASSSEYRKEQAELTAELNSLVLSCTSSERFVTLFWGRYDRSVHQLSYVNCGHPPALLIRGESNGNAKVEPLETGGPVLGLLPNLTYQHGITSFQPGDLLVVYSDGVVEASNAKEIEFGEERLIKILVKNRDRPVKEIGRLVVDEVNRFTGRSAYEDDLTLLVIRA
jgi:sigma-B regulation protein RsbU (phosphoserine phosphatase)